MIRIRRSEERGHADHGWLDTRHTFSFADYYDPRHMGFRSLRVINEDRVQPGQGFGKHQHRDMEIITVVLEGGLAHKDSIGGAAKVVAAGEVQRMTAGTGVQHSEFNASKEEPVHFLQIWIEPAQRGLPPSYEQRAFPIEADEGGPKLRLIAAPKACPSARDGALEVHQNVALYRAHLGTGEKVHHELAAGRHAWVHVVRGAVTVNGTALRAGDGAAVSEERALEMAGAPAGGGEVLLFDLA